VTVGSDVAKTQLDVAVRPAGEQWQAPNDEQGVAALVERLTHLVPTLVVLEATGGLERVVAAARATAGLPVAVVNRRQVRYFAKAFGQLAKTDALDAQLLARFAEAVRPVPRPLADTANKRWQPCWPAAARWWACALRRASGWAPPVLRCANACERTSAGWNASWPPWTTPSGTPCARAPSGASGRTCYGACRGSAPSWP
jgi:hypothetical protein